MSIPVHQRSPGAIALALKSEEFDLDWSTLVIQKNITWDRLARYNELTDKKLRHKVYLLSRLITYIGTSSTASASTRCYADVSKITALLRNLFRSPSVLPFIQQESEAHSISPRKSNNHCNAYFGFNGNRKICNRGDECQYSHCIENVRTCHRWTNSVCDNPMCPFLHGTIIDGVIYEDETSGNKDGTTILHIAVKNCYTRTVEILLSQPTIDINAVDKNGRTPLHIASNHDDHQMAWLLMSNERIDLNKTDHDGNYPIPVGYVEPRLVHLLMFGSE